MTTYEEWFNRDEMQAPVEALVSPLLAQYQYLGLVVGLQSGNRSVVYGYGTHDETSLSVPHARTVFEIGSITKVFTAILLATMVEDGLVSLNTPLRSLLPECPDLPEEITLLRLATHTSRGFLASLPISLKPLASIRAIPMPTIPWRICMPIWQAMLQICS